MHTVAFTNGGNLPATVELAPPVWEALLDVAERCSLSPGEIVARLDAGRGVVSLHDAIEVFLYAYLRIGASPAAGGLSEAGGADSRFEYALKRASDAET